MSSAKAPTPVEKGPWLDYKKMILEPIKDTGVELTALFPDSILFGSLLLYAITQNASFGVLSVFSLEMSVLHKVVSFVYTKTLKQVMPEEEKPGKKQNLAEQMRCRPGYKAARLEYERVFAADTPPSLSMFFWGGLVAYMAGSNYSFSAVLDSMQQEWWTRIVVSIVGIALLTFVFIMGRMECDSFTEIMIAFFLGIVAGIGCYIVNLNVFGLEGVNFNGLPFLSNKTDTGSPIYVCAPPTA
jgi:hypothetical protein